MKDAARMCMCVGGMCMCVCVRGRYVCVCVCSLVPRPPRPAFVGCITKSGGRSGRTYHVMRAMADVMFSLLTSGFVLSPSLFFP